MDIEKIRNDFQIYVVDDEESIRSILMETLTGVGFQVETFPTAEDALAAIKTNPPHVVLSDIRMPGMSGIQLLEKVRELSTDIQYIIMTSHASLETAVHAMKLGAYDYLNKPFDELQEVVTTVDRTIERVYLKYQNEQLLEELNHKNNALTSLNARITQEKEEVVRINSFLATMNKTIDLSQVTEIFLKEASELLGGTPILFFKHLPAYFSLVVSAGVQVPAEKLRRVGLNYKDQNPKEYVQKLRQPESMLELSQLLSQAFGVTEFLALPLENDQEVEGVVVVFSQIQDAMIQRMFDSFYQIFRVSYNNALMQKRIHNMAIKDPLTGLYNRRYFNEKLPKEISRSRRTKLPTSLLYMDIDHFKKYNDQNGHPMGDVLLKMIGSVLKKTSRANDVVCRIGGEEFTIILPHTDKVGAALKAEKLRRVIEGTDFPHSETQPLGCVSFSIGVSEYPTLAGDQEALVKSADEALYQVKSTSRNKVCLATVPEGFEPDFVPEKPKSNRNKG